ncbi:Peptidase C1A papain C-terminal [Arabidopsis suecica]|uniref:Peptidase C1A papain C-terminal n=1 Tax=Arabidopsis suecica TaxID=45249 RepID=A0A8T1YI08_ARASU|nr:Peptidase C1A papain C-terminal [Arabidopsis suecica]
MSSIMKPKELLSVTRANVKVLAHILEIIPVGTFSQIMATTPNSGIKVEEVLEAVYARWRVSRHVQDSLKGTDWEKKMCHMRDQGCCETCWAVVVSELISALLFVEGIDKEYTEYSIQELVDFADPSKAGTHKDRKHYCYTLSIGKGLDYVLKHGLQKAIHRKYVGCRPKSEIPARSTVDLAHITRVDRLSFPEALIRLKRQPIGASLYIFTPDYVNTKGGVYRGPMEKESKLEGVHAVSILGVTEEKGEMLFKVKSTHGDRVGVDGYLKVSMEVMLVQIPKKGTLPDGKFEKPTPLIHRFCCPTIIPKAKGESSAMQCD